jgi:hypothetical protein
LWWAPAAALCCLLFAVQTFAADATPVDIFRNPSMYAGQSITVRGSVANVRPAQMAPGPPATVFDVLESGAFVTVLTRIPLPCFAGSTVTVTGLFQPSRFIGRERFVNLIEAFSVSCQ